LTVLFQCVLFDLAGPHALRRAGAYGSASLLGLVDALTLSMAQSTGTGLAPGDRARWPSAC
jgi:hypothetical protein